jgi:DNA repair exonuclease SbcCD nuclease subunit
MYTIPGQHDLPEHSIKNIYRSAYETLCRAETILSLSCPATYPSISTSQYTLSPFPFDTKIKPLLNYCKTTINIAIVHDFVCTARTAHPKAPKEAYIGKTSNSNLINGKLYGYDVIVYGDNHKSFLTHVGKTVIWNCGTLMRRKSDEVDYKPRVGLLFSNGKVEPYYLDVSKDKHLTAEEVKDVEDVEEQDMEVFAEELRKLGASALDFAEAMKEFWRSDKTRKAVQNIIQKAMEK